MSVLAGNRRTRWRRSGAGPFWHAARQRYASDAGLARLPSFELRDLDGVLRRSHELTSGHPTIFVVSSPHCKPCEALYPAIRSHASREADVSFVLLSRGARQTNRALNLAHGLDDVVILGSRNAVERALEVRGTPFAALVSPDGFVFWKGFATPDVLARLVDTAKHPLTSSMAG